MTADRIKSYIIALLFPAAVALSLLSSNDTMKNAVLAAICIIYAAVAAASLKKRSILSTERSTVLIVVIAASIVMIALTFIAGIKFGLMKNPFTTVYIWKYILPFTVIVIFSEQIRRVLLSRQEMGVLIITFIAFVFLDCAMQFKQDTFRNYHTFVSFVGLTVFPAISTNIFCSYISRRYGALPNIAYRLIQLLWRYLFPIVPKTPDMLLAFAKFVFAPALMLLVYALFSKSKHNVYARKRTASTAVLATLCIIAVSLTMLVSCQFTYRFLIIASPSMTGSLDTGDGVVYRAYNNTTIKEGDILVYNKGKIRVVHRVINIEYVDGEFRYYTRGDANDAADPWYVTVSEIEGIVIARIRYVGYPTLALRSLFT